MLTSFAASTLPPTISAVGYTKSAKEDGRLLVSAIGVGLNVYDVSANFFSISLLAAIRATRLARNVHSGLTSISGTSVGRPNDFGSSHARKRISTDHHRRLSLFAYQLD